MSKRAFFLIVPVLAGLAVVLGGGQTFAQGPAGGSPQAMVSPAFTYQGQLKDSAGTPITNSCDFTFSLWDALSAGSQVGGNCTVTGVSVANGYFAARVNGGGEFGGSAFSGDARWLEIAVQCSGDPGYTTLAPRQELTAAPYALSLRPGAQVVGGVSGGAVILAQNTAANGTGVYGMGPNAVVGDSSSSNYGAVVGRNYATTGAGMGVYGLSASADPNTAGVYGYANAAGGQTYGVYGRSDSTDGTGLYGYASATSGAADGVVGTTAAPGETAVFTLYSTGVSGYANSPSGPTAGVWGQSASTEGIGVRGWASANDGTTYGVYGLTDSNDGYGVYGYNNAGTGTSYGVYGQSDSTAGYGTYGFASATSGFTYGVQGRALSTNGTGVHGYVSAGSGNTRGVWGQSLSTDGVGVDGSGGRFGVRGFSLSGAGVYGSGPNGVVGMSDSPGYAAVYGQNEASTGRGSGVYGQSDSTDGFGVIGYTNGFTNSSAGVVGLNPFTAGLGQSSVGVVGVSGETSWTFIRNAGVGVLGSVSRGADAGVLGLNTAAGGPGVYGWASTTGGYAVYGRAASSTANYAGYFLGNVHVTGNLSKGGGSFLIDHPLDPTNKYLYHSFVESPDMMNVYNGNATLDTQGEAWIQLPDWFEALNMEFRYQLTPVGAPMPNLYVAEKIKDNRFKIAGGMPGYEVSWLVTGIRHDPYADAHRIPVEEWKPLEKRGKYLYPELYGQPASAAEDYGNWFAVETRSSPVTTPAGQPR